MGRRAVLWGLGLLLGAQPAAAAPAALAGYYRLPLADQSGALILAVAPCGADRYCGRLVDLGPLPAKDLRNPSREAQSRALCGLDILSFSDDDKLQGTFYDPRTGDQKAVGLWIGPGGEIHIDGRAGWPVVSRVYSRPEIWQKVAGPQTACDAARPVS